MAAAFIALAATAAAAAVTERLSVASDGAQADLGSTASAISTDGRVVAFVSAATDLVAGDTNAALDVFVRDRASGATERASVASDGTEANGPSSAVALSGDGRFVAFASTARNLVADDANGRFDVFVHDRVTGATERASLGGGGAEGNADSFQPAISGDGRYVAFASGASNLVAGDSNGAFDVFVRDRVAGTVERVSIASDGAQANGSSLQPRLSADGRLVVFHSSATNLVPGDTNAATDVFVHDRATGVTERVSVDSNGVQGDRQSVAGSLSADGRFVAFSSDARNLVPGDTNGRTDVFVHDRSTGATERVSVATGGVEGNNSSGFVDPPAISATGRFVAFATSATNMFPGDANNATDVVLHDRVTGETTVLNVASDGTQGNAGTVLWPQISADGRVVTFTSTASNLVADDTNLVQDVFAWVDTCGNGALDPGEQCDDGNTADGDCCSARCRVEPAGSACSDGDACTQVDACDGAGACVGSQPVVCAGGGDVCQGTASCDPATGACVQGAAPAGTPCDDGDACTQLDACDGGGSCVGSQPVVCPGGADDCQSAPTCDPSTGACVQGMAPAGTPCDDGDACTQADACDGAGACVGGSPVVCSGGAGPCQAAPSCDPSSGQCVSAPSPDGSVCDDGDACTVGDACVGGACVPGEVEPWACLDTFRCYDASLSWADLARFRPRHVQLADELASQAYWSGPPSQLCAPALVGNAQGTARPDLSQALLSCRPVEKARDAGGTGSPASRRLTVTNELGQQTLTTHGVRRLCLAAGVAAVPPSGALDAFTCYAASATRGMPAPAPRTVAIADGLSTSVMVVSDAEMVCNPTSVDGSAVAHAVAHLVCYDLDPPARTSGRGDTRLLTVSTSLGAEKLAVFKPRRVCLPTRVDQSALEVKKAGRR